MESQVRHSSRSLRQLVPLVTGGRGRWRWYSVTSSRDIQSRTLGQGCCHPHSGFIFSPQFSLSGKFPKMYPQVSLLGDSKSRQADSEDEPSKPVFWILAVLINMLLFPFALQGCYRTQCLFLCLLTFCISSVMSCLLLSLAHFYGFFVFLLSSVF